MDSEKNAKDRRGKGKNLLRNPCAKDGLNCWKLACNRGNGFVCEEIPVGCKQLCECSSIKGIVTDPIQDIQFCGKKTSGLDLRSCPDMVFHRTAYPVVDQMPCWATSYGLCEKYQLVYLPKFNISEHELDEKKPPIRIQDWYSARSDCGCEYGIKVFLLADDKETILDTWNFTDTREEGSDWTKVEHVFQTYPSGVRYVEFTHGGKDTKYWAGHYGVKMTNSGVFVDEERRKNTFVREKLGKNLLKNPCASSKLAGWEVVINGGNGWSYEGEPAGCKPIKEVNEDAEGESCWSTSYEDCEKKQVIDLGFEGFDSDYMDETQPEIRVSEWFGSRSDAGCWYWLKVRLLNSYMEMVYEKNIRVKKENTGDWYKVEESIKDYGSGVRFVEYSHGGRDTCGWAGNYGAKISCSFVGVYAEAETSSSPSSSFDEY